MPSSTSAEPTAEPAASPVTKQFTEGPSQVPSCSVTPLNVVGCGSPRAQRPRGAVFAPDVSVQPPAASKLSLNRFVVVAGWNSAVSVVSSLGVVISCVACPPSDQDTKSYVVPPEVCGVTTPSVRITPSTPVNENGAVIGAPSSVSCAFETLLSRRTTEVSGRTSAV